MLTHNQIADLFFSKHEFNHASRDEYNRVIPALEKSEYLKPVVSEYLLANGFNPVYPGNKKFAVCITHDIDWLFKPGWPVKSVLNQQTKAMMRFDFKKFTQNQINSKRNRIDDLQLEQTLKYYQQAGVRSTAFFLSLNKGESDFNYSTAEITDQFNLLKKNGCEIGLHGGHTAYNNSSKMLSEKLKLEANTGSKINGYRNHYLRFEPGLTWELISSNGFLYDGTFGFANAPGFRNGICHPFKAYNQNRKSGNLIVLPLNLMDVSLWDYLKLDQDEMFLFAKKMIHTIEAHNGVFTLLWHNNFMSGWQGALFKQIIDYCLEKDAFFDTCEGIVGYYKSMGYDKQVESIMNSCVS